MEAKDMMDAKDIIASGIALGALLISLMGLLYTRWQIHRAQISQRGVLFKELYQKFFDDEEMKYVYTLTENGEEIFLVPDDRVLSEDKIPNAEEKVRRKKAVERLFAHLEVICALYKNKLLAPDDMQHFHYNVQRLIQYRGFVEFRHYLEKQWPSDKNLERGPYASVFWYIDKSRSSATT